MDTNTKNNDSELKNKETETTEETSVDNLVEVDLMRAEFESFTYDLPDFDLLAEDFDVEKAYEKDSSFLLREIRKTVIEKLSAYLQLFETFMNPSSPPMFIMTALRGLEKDDRETIKDVYQALSRYQLWAVKLDTVYDEAKEAVFIRDAFNEWQLLKKKVYEVLEKLEKEQVETVHEVKGGYFG